MDSFIIAVDFDGTLCESKWPEIGEAKEEMIDFVKRQQSRGAKLILWTNRTGQNLDNAVAWCAEHGLFFDSVNENLPESVEAFGSDSRKVFAHVYIDDKALHPEYSVYDMARWPEIHF